MAEQTLPNDFREFLKLLKETGVEYLLIGGYAVGYYGYPRATQDIDIWIAINPENAARIVTVFSKSNHKNLPQYLVSSIQLLHLKIISVP